LSGETRDETYVQEELRELRRHVCELEEREARQALVEKALRLSERYFHSLIEHSTDLITIMDPDGRVTYESPAIEDILGYDEEELLGMNALVLVHPDDLEEAGKAIAGVLADPEAVVPFKCRLRHKDGSWRVLDGSGKAIHDGQDLQGIIVNSRDVTAGESMREELAAHRDRLEELVAGRTRELEEANRRLRSEIERRIRVEEELREREERYRLLAENVGDVIWTCDLDFNWIYISPSVEAQSGFSVEETMSMSIKEMVTPPSLEKAMEMMHEAGKAFLAGELDLDKTWRLELEQYRKDGSTTWVELMARILKGPGGVPAGLLGVSRDIGERKRAELELRHSERYYRSLIEHSYSVISVMDPDGTMSFVSPNVKAVFGYEPEELLGRSAFDFTHPDDLPGVLKEIAGGVDQPGKVAFLEYRWRHKDGSWRVCEAVGKNLLHDPAVRGAVVHSRDVTMQRAMERALRESEEKHRSLVENLNDVVFNLDTQGNLLYISPVVEKLAGYRPEDVMGRSFAEFIHPDDIEEVTRSFQETLNGVLNPAEFRTIGKDGGILHVRTFSKPLYKDGELAGTTGILNDITAQKKAELALRESEEKFRVLSDQSMLAIFIIQEGGIRYANQAASGIFEYTAEEILAWEMEDISRTVHPEDAPFVLDQMRRKLRGEGGYVANYCMRAITRSGEEKWVEIFSKTVPFGGRPADMVTMVDISDRKRMEEELKESEERFRFLIEKAADVILVVDGRGMVTYVSPSVERVLGYAVEEVVGKAGFAFIDEMEVEATQQALASLATSPGEPMGAELHVRHKDGSWREVEVTASNYLDHPSVRGVIVNYRDITDRKAMLRRLETINHLFLSLGADLFENMEKIVDTCREVLEGQLAAYCRLEKGMYTVLSTAPGEEGFFVANDPETLIAHRVVSLGMSGPLIVEDLEVSPYRESDPLIVRHGPRSFVGYPVWQKKQAIGCLCLFFPEPREFSHYEVEFMGMLARALSVEEERLAYEQSLKDFIDVASHELRHPITLMKGYATTLSRYGDRLDDDEKREYLGIINGGADRLDMLIKELLDASRIERGRFKMQRGMQDLRPLLEQAVKEIKDKGCPQELTLDADGGLSPRDVDGEKLERVLVILLDNAVAHSPAHFAIEITAAESDGRALISVIDRGVGIPDRDRELIFERFYQVEDALHHTTRGMGLGLYIAREIVEAHGGRIWYEPNPGGGSIFRFTIP
jgi:PAS domain S-box-containing protein